MTTVSTDVLREKYGIPEGENPMDSQYGVIDLLKDPSTARDAAQILLNRPLGDITLIRVRKKLYRLPGY